MNRVMKKIGALSIISLAFLLVSCGAQKQLDNSADFVPSLSQVDASNIKQKVFEFDGYAMVLFYNTKFWESRDMHKRFSFFADKYRNEIVFCEYIWDVQDQGQAYALELLPTVILYKSGQELDRIKGIPRNEKDRMKWNNDINLWIIKNVLGAEGDKHSGTYSYRFNNSSSLKISNY